LFCILERPILDVINIHILINRSGLLATLRCESSGGGLSAASEDDATLLQDYSPPPASKSAAAAPAAGPKGTPASPTHVALPPLSLRDHAMFKLAEEVATTLRVRPPLPVDRVWATVLAMEVLKEFDSTWLLDDDAPEPWRTVVDGGAEYLDAPARADRRVRKLLKCGARRDAAQRARRDWKRIQAANVAALRDADVINRYTALEHMQRTSERVVRSVMTQHSMFATFLDTDGYIMRWQRLMILITLVLSTLLVSIW
jgi:hypothetical protein